MSFFCDRLPDIDNYKEVFGLVVSQGFQAVIVETAQQSDYMKMTTGARTSHGTNQEAHTLITSYLKN